MRCAGAVISVPKTEKFWAEAQVTQYQNVTEASLWPMLEFPGRVPGEKCELAGGRGFERCERRSDTRCGNVESASVQIAQKFDNEEFAIPPNRLSDIETKGIVPSIYRLYTWRLFIAGSIASCLLGTVLN